MLAKLVCGALGALVLAAGAAQASDATTVADRAGFLIGHAQRCGVAQARLERSTKRIGAVIAAFAADDQDREAAQAQFTESLTASALSQLLGDNLPSCAIVRSTFADFEQHRASGDHRERQMARSDRHGAATARHAANAGVTSGKASRQASTRQATTTREARSAERRAELELLRTAQQSGGKIPLL